MYGNQMNAIDLRKKILELVLDYGEVTTGAEVFQPGTTRIPPSGKVLSGEELSLMTDAVLDGWLTTGRFNDKFEKQLKAFVDVKEVATTNSGSSAHWGHAKYTSWASTEPILPPLEVIRVQLWPPHVATARTP